MANTHILTFIFNPNSSRIVMLCSFEADPPGEDAEVGGQGGAARLRDEAICRQRSQELLSRHHGSTMTRCT